MSKTHNSSCLRKNILKTMSYREIIKEWAIKQLKDESITKTRLHEKYQLFGKVHYRIEEKMDRLFLDILSQQTNTNDSLINGGLAYSLFGIICRPSYLSHSEIIKQRIKRRKRYYKYKTNTQ